MKGDIEVLGDTKFHADRALAFFNHDENNFELTFFDGMKETSSLVGMSRSAFRSLAVSLASLLIESVVGCDDDESGEEADEEAAEPAVAVTE